MDRIIDGNTARMLHDEARAYHSTKALSKSSMDALLRCPAHFKQTLDEMDGTEHGQTPAMLMGSIFHAMTLEPFSLDAQYRVRRNSGSTKAGKEEAAEAAAQGVALVAPDVWETCRAMSAAASLHPLFKAARAARDWQAETSIYWQERGSIPCKARIDAVASLPGFGLCAIDLKSTTDASPDAISKHIYDYGYHRQAAWYLHALRRAGMDARQFVFLFCEKAAPYLTTAVTVAESAIGVAYDEIRSALDKYEECAASGVWPGYTNEIVTEIDLPAWAYRRNAA